MDTAQLTDEQIRERTAHFQQFLTPERLERIEQVLADRTRYLTVVLEDIFQPHNASAVLRSCDGFGVQDIHVIENRNTFSPHKGVELGTSQWLNLFRYREKADNTAETLSSLKADGYRIVATSPHSRDVDLEDLEVRRGPMALVFGTELTGLSETALSMADEYVKIPMYGFVESFNISVSCAIALHHLTHTMRQTDLDIALSPREAAELRLIWSRLSVKRPQMHDQLLT